MMNFVDDDIKIDKISLVLSFLFHLLQSNINKHNINKTKLLLLRRFGCFPSLLSHLFGKCPKLITSNERYSAYGYGYKMSNNILS